MVTFANFGEIGFSNCLKKLIASKTCVFCYIYCTKRNDGLRIIMRKVSRHVPNYPCLKYILNDYFFIRTHVGRLPPPDTLGKCRRSFRFVRRDVFLLFKLIFFIPPITTKLKQKLTIYV